MPILISAFRYFRHHLIFGLIAVILLVYFVFNIFFYEKGFILGDDFDDINDAMVKDSHDDLSNDEFGDGDIMKLAGKPLLWQMEVMNDVGNVESGEYRNTDDSNDNRTSLLSCRNSVQGKSLIVDEKGFVCTRFEVLSNGCCDVKSSIRTDTVDNPVLHVKRKRYSCDSCNDEGCCLVYEYCVSCCLDPNKSEKKKSQDAGQIKHENLRLRRGVDILKLRLRNLDHFQTCLAACRTSSSSVVHENTYKNPDLKHCYILQLTHTNGNEKNEKDWTSLNNNEDGLRVSVTHSSDNFS